MGDISELRGLLVAGGFISCMVALILLVPSEFGLSGTETRDIEVPNYFDSVDLEYYASTVNMSYDDTGAPFGPNYYYDLVVGGHNVRIWDIQGSSTYVLHYWYWWIFPTNFHTMTWYAEDGEDRGPILTNTELDGDYGCVTCGGNVRYTLQCDHFQMTAFFGFNETLYSLPSDAWDNNDLHLMFAITLDQTNTSVNAWSLISMLLFFQLPDMPPTINVIISIPLWISIAYITYIIILRAIGAIFGGGA